MQSKKIYTVSEINHDIKGIISGNFEDVSVEGELSNFKLHSSGHMYGSLKDEKSVIRIAFFRGANQYLKFKPESGLKVVVHGSVDVYEKSGDYQIIVDRMDPAGLGALQLRLEQLKKKLLEEGLFEISRKRPIPVIPRKIGIVTSPTGAVINDMLNIITRRFPNVHIVLNPVKVQGEGAAEEIAEAIKQMDEMGDCDVLIVGRGGGSFEDLFAFNEEVVVRAIYECRIPVISAVGHEPDHTLSDDVADRSAPTPSAAAELVILQKEDVKKTLHNYGIRLNKGMFKIFDSFSDRVENIRKVGIAASLKKLLSIYRERLAGILRSRAFLKPKAGILEFRQQIDDIGESLDRSFKHYAELKRNEVKNMQGKLTSLNPLKILERGYSVTLRKDGSIVKEAKTLDKNEEIEVKFYKGSISAKVEEIK